MNIGEKIAEKKNISTAIKENFNLLKKNRSTGIVILSDKEVEKNLLESFKILPSNFVIVTEEKFDDIKEKNIGFISHIKKELITGFDFIVTDNNFEDLKLYMEKGVTPIIDEKNYLGSLLEEFSPIKSSGNCFNYKNSSNIFDINYALVRYLENFKFPYDNKNLVKNVFSI